MIQRLRQLASVLFGIGYPLLMLTGIVAGSWAIGQEFEKAKQQPTPAMRVYFAPGPDCERAAVELIGRAEKTIHVRAYNFSNQAIRDSLAAAAKRGVSIVCIVDHRALAERKCIARYLVTSGCDVFDDANHKISHAKVIAIDSRTVLCGSFNWSEAAKKNSEAMIVRENDPEFAAEFERNFELHLAEPKTSRVK